MNELPSTVTDVAVPALQRPVVGALGTVVLLAGPHVPSLVVMPPLLEVAPELEPATVPELEPVLEPVLDPLDDPLVTVPPELDVVAPLLEVVPPELLVLTTPELEPELEVVPLDPVATPLELEVVPELEPVVVPELDPLDDVPPGFCCCPICCRIC